MFVGIQIKEEYKMKQIRRNVFETNSSSSHSISIEYIQSQKYVEVTHLPEGRWQERPSVFDVLNFPLVQRGIANSEIEKLRILVSLITELVEDEYRKKLKDEWVEKYQSKDRKSFDYYGFYDFYGKKIKQKMARRYMYEHSYWKYLNALLKKKKNIVIELHDTISYFPFISERVDYEEGAETECYYHEVGLTFNMSRADFMKKCEEIIFNSDVAIFQSCYRD